VADRRRASRLGCGSRGGGDPFPEMSRPPPPVSDAKDVRDSGAGVSIAGARYAGGA